MKTISSIALCCFISLSVIATHAQTSDRDLVYAAIEDYVDGIYLVQPDRIKKSVHPQLAKRGFWKGKDQTAYEESTMTFDQLVELAGKWNAKGRVKPEEAPKKIEIFDVQDQTALGKLTAYWGTDYFELAKYDGKWLIVNILWQSHPPKSNN
jgi:hypothetical protein